MRYQKEENVPVNFEPDSFEPKIVDYGSVICRYIGKEGAWYPTTSSIEKSQGTRANISKAISEILRIDFKDNNNLNIGLVIPKDVPMRQFIPRKFEKVKVLTFGNLRGKNSLELCDVLFIVGTYCINKEDMAQEHSLWFARDSSTNEFVEDKPHGDFYHYKDPNMELLRWMSEDYEMYQAIHRIRPLLSKKQVYVFGIVPKEITQDGLKVIKIKGGYEVNKNYREWLLDYVKQKSSVPEKLVRLEMKNKFGIELDTAYREIKKVVKENSEQLRFDDSRGLRMLVCMDA